MKEGKILFLVPASSARGGITNYFNVLRDEFPEEIEYYIRGSRTWPKRKGFFKELYRAYLDYKRFKQRLSYNDIKLIQTSTSLGITTTIRDGLFIRYACKKGIKTITFFRGWDEKSWESIKRNKALFKFFFFKSDKIITLSERARIMLKEIGYSKEIITETTTFDRNLINDISEKSIAGKFKDIIEFKELNILFLSRLERRKGIYELLEAFEILSHRSYPFKISLTICGDGSEFKKIKNLVQSKRLKNIFLLGFVQGEIKKEVFKKAHLFVLPSYGEGMPNAVLEAMGSGIPVITTKVGGIVDFFVQDVNGYFIDFNNSIDIVIKIDQMISNIENLTKMALSNYRVANQKFRSDLVAKRILAICLDTIGTN